MYFAGHWDKQGTDYDSSWAAMPRVATGKMLDSIACQRGLYIFQTDVATCFNQNRPIERLVIGRLPKPLRSFAEDGEELVWRALVCSYGLPEATSEWAATFDQWILQDMRDPSPSETRRRQAAGLPLQRFHFQRSEQEESLYVATLPNGKRFSINRIVDDVRAYVTDPADWVAFRALFAARFQITGGEQEFVNGSYNGAYCEYDRVAGAMAYSIETPIDRLLQRVELADVKPSGVPMLHRANVDITKADQPTSATDKAEAELFKGKYATLVCACLWLANYAPEISFAVTFLARWLKNPGKKMFGAAKILAGYLKGRRSLRYFLRRTSDGPALTAHLQRKPTAEINSSADASHNDNADGTTTIGYLLRYGNSVILARTLKLKHVTLSTNESELSAQTECGRDIVSFRHLLTELGEAPTGPTVMDCDSAGAIAVAERRSPTNRTKHIRLRDKWVRQLVSSGAAVLKYRRTSELLADVLSKPVPGPLFTKTRREMLLLSTAFPEASLL